MEIKPLTFLASSTMGRWRIPFDIIFSMQDSTVSSALAVTICEPNVAISLMGVSLDVRPNKATLVM